tara:strand:- start:27 stop:326 length:300 start_codon:yes stop_codon:yes gene_type:complete
MQQKEYFKECLKAITIPSEWTSESYYNDVCPSFSFNGYQIFVDHEDPKERDDAGRTRFSITLLAEYGYGNGWVYHTESFDKVLQEIQKPISDRPKGDLY